MNKPFLRLSREEMENDSNMPFPDEYDLSIFYSVKGEKERVLLEMRNC